MDGYVWAMTFSTSLSEQQPMRSKHCQTCQHCVRRYDHHCPWIENCVGERNHRWFVLYLAIQLIVLLWGFHMAWYVYAEKVCSVLSALSIEWWRAAVLQYGYYLYIAQHYIFKDKSGVNQAIVLLFELIKCCWLEKEQKKFIQYTPNSELADNTN